ncbi:MAG: nitrile hydratase subunit alpha [Gammaproteobacteria bacterium]|nr:nitrile hydratase subunit alpha [Gammaproteobacteria bacterium]
MSEHDHRHDHDHAHAHEAPPSPYHRSERTSERNAELTERVAKLEALLTEKGLVAKDALDKLVDVYEHDLGPMNGAKVVARAWVDPAFKQRLLENATSAVAELGFGGLQGEHLVAVENTPQVHNVVVCTLCSCYPWPVLGLPPAWYKDAAYRSRVVIDPRGVLREFGTELGDDVEVRVWDSSAEVRYLVLPERPAGTDGWNEEQLAAIVGRDAMIGVTRALPA